MILFTILSTRRIGILGQPTADDKLRRRCLHGPSALCGVAAG